MQESHSRCPATDLPGWAREAVTRVFGDPGAITVAPVPTKPIIRVTSDRVVASSKDVATYFGKAHKHVLDDMTRDGFTLLAIGFTGAKALKFKLAYIAEFNAMEEKAKRCKRLTLWFRL